MISFQNVLINQINSSIKAFVLLLIIFSYTNEKTFSQDVLGWKNYSDMKNVSDATLQNNTFWCATSGGVFSFSLNDSIFQTYNKTEGLNGSPITAISIDNQGKIWLGSENGIIDIYNQSTKSFKRILDIYNSGRTLKQINNFRVEGDVIFVSTDFGLSSIDTKAYNFIDTYFKFGTFSSNIKVKSSFKSDRLFVATDLGLAVQVLGTTNLSAPESWNVYSTNNGLPSNNVKKIQSFKDTLIISSDRGFIYFDGNSFQRFLPHFNQINIVDFISVGDSLLILTSETVASVTSNKQYVYFSGNLQQLNLILPPTNKIIGRSDADFYLATSKGVLRVSGSSQDYFYPDGPQSNFFNDMSVDSRSNLWVASGTDVTGVGFYRLNSSGWKNFNLTTTPEILSNSYYNSFSAPDGINYIGGFGSGFARIKNDNEITVFNTTNTPMLGIARNPEFLVIAGLRTDSKGNLWILNHDAVNRKTLSLLTQDSVWYNFVNRVDSNLNQYTKLVIDQYDTKWFVSAVPAKSGLFYFNENNTLNNLADDKYGFVTQNSGLNSNSISSIVVDKRGDMWIGTNLGVNIISNTSVVLGSNATPQFNISSVFSLRQYSINCIAVDPINRKWIGTNQGLIVVTADGSKLIAAYDSKNSPLLSDQIKSIAIDDNLGIVYVGVDGGLTSIQTSAVLPKESFDDISIYPSPFILNNNSNPLKIDGLIKDSDIKILSISGKLIKEFSSPGGRIAFWDGRDNSENFVSSGIYIVVAFDKEGNNVTTSKIAVVRE